MTTTTIERARAGNVAILRIAGDVTSASEGDLTQGIPIVQAGCFGERLGRVTIQVTAEGVDVVNVCHEVVDNEWPADQRVLDELAACERDLQVWLEQPVHRHHAEPTE